ncbi:hypothetical protein [Burkholderia pyrrocinia]|uniref:hypothetical protein n=1 Tax=Burkholderia pyrrocinia TaxID=60550 RepID=UPI001BCA7FB2|nr:hypothetical protein [Burkholderia pyrrocinia]QVN18959.1 hypothetical protein JYG32_04265 [Burkholderia pyrrocinia]
MNTKKAHPHPASLVRTAMLGCARAIALSIVGVTLVALLVYGLYLAGPTIGDGIVFVWYAWAHILTGSYTTVLPAALIDWGALLITAWMICVSVKLGEAGHDAWLGFAAAAVAAFVLGVVPANCAIWAVENLDANYVTDLTGVLNVAASATASAVVAFGPMCLAVSAMWVIAAGAQ